MVVDAWLNLFPPGIAEAWSSRPENAAVGDLFGEDLSRGRTVDELVTAMDEAGVATGVLACGLRPPARRSPQDHGSHAAEDFLALADEHQGRFLISVIVDQATRPVDNCRRIRELAQHDKLALVRVTPLIEQYELNHRLYYPVYATCAELRLPVSVNVGIPGPRLRSRCQDPVLLEDLLIDFPELTVIGAHMGHPYEGLLIQYMLKWPQLYLMTSAYLATYMDPALVRFMDSSRGRGRVWFASDHPVIPVNKALDAARKLPLSEGAMAEFLGDSALRVLDPSGRRST